MNNIKLMILIFTALTPIFALCLGSEKSGLNREQQPFRRSNIMDIGQKLLSIIYHQKEDAIRSHVLICFVALIIEKYLELTTKITLRNIRTLVWNITESHIRDTMTKETFKFISPTSEITNSPLVSLIKKWKLLPH
jgi:hypothetical protein